MTLAGRDHTQVDDTIPGSQIWNNWCDHLPRD